MNFIIIVLLLFFSDLVFAQTVSVPISVAASALENAQQKIVDYTSRIKEANDYILQIQKNITERTNVINALQADLDVQKQNITTVATMNPPLLPATFYCNANPTNCVNWTTVTFPDGSQCSQNLDCVSNNCVSNVCLAN